MTERFILSNIIATIRYCCVTHLYTSNSIWYNADFNIKPNMHTFMHRSPLTIYKA